MYVAGWGEIYEVSYNHGNWDSIKIDTGGQRVEELFVTDGRNDGVFRLYAAINEHIYEYTWSGSEWETVDCSAIGNEPYILSCDMYGGDARNDGKNRIYLVAGGLYELSYNAKNWDSIVIADSNKIGAVTIGIGNDGINHLYTGSSTGIGEYTFSNGAWKKTANYDTKYKVNDLTVGQGRNDEVNHIYATSDDNHVYEYSYTGGKISNEDNVVNNGTKTTPKENVYLITATLIIVSILIFIRSKLEDNLLKNRILYIIAGILVVVISVVTFLMDIISNVKLVFILILILNIILTAVISHSRKHKQKKKDEKQGENNEKEEKAIEIETKSQENVSVKTVTLELLMNIIGNIIAGLIIALILH